MKTCNETTVQTVEFGELGNVLILLGGTDSDRDIVPKVMGFDGKKFDLAEFEKTRKPLSIMSDLDREFFIKHLRHFEFMDLTVPDDVRILHQFCGEMGFDDKQRDAFFNRLAYVTKKPKNVIFHAALSDSDTVISITASCDLIGGYKRDNIHVGWILDDCSPESLKMPLEKSNSLTEPEYSDEGCPFGEILDGDIWFFFPRGGNDGECENAAIGAVRIKKSGQPMPNNKTIMSMKINKFDADGQLIPGGKHTVDELIGRNE